MRMIQDRRHGFLGSFLYLPPNNAVALFDRTVNHVSWPASTLVAPMSVGICDEPRAPALAMDLARMEICARVIRKGGGRHDN